MGFRYCCANGSKWPAGATAAPAPVAWLGGMRQCGSLCPSRRGTPRAHRQSESRSRAAVCVFSLRPGTRSGRGRRPAQQCDRHGREVQSQAGHERGLREGFPGHGEGRRELRAGQHHLRSVPSGRGSADLCGLRALPEPGGGRRARQDRACTATDRRPERPAGWPAGCHAARARELEAEALAGAITWRTCCTARPAAASAAGRAAIIATVLGAVAGAHAPLAAAQTQDAGPTQVASSINSLKGLSIEDLMKTEVTSVSKAEEPLSDAAAAIYVITRDDILRSGAQSLPDMLRLAPNLQVAQITTTSY